MLKVQNLLLLTLLIASPVLGAPANRDGDLGLGFQVGDTSSLTGKYWTSQQSAIEIAGGGNRSQEGFLQVSANRHFLSAFGSNTRFVSETNPYTGVGLGVGFNRTIAATKYQNDYYVRIPLGVSWLPNRTPVDIFAELAPTWTFSPSSVFSFSGNVGGRYYF